MSETILPIRDERAHESALAEIDRLWDSRPGTPEGDRLEVLFTLVHAYEAVHFPMPEVDPPTLIAHALEDMGRTREELDGLVGSHEAAGEVLARRRHMTRSVSEGIEKAWHLPEGILGRPYWLEGQPG